MYFCVYLCHTFCSSILSSICTTILHRICSIPAPVVAARLAAIIADHLQSLHPLPSRLLAADEVSGENYPHQQIFFRAVTFSMSPASWSDLILVTVVAAGALDRWINPNFRMITSNDNLLDDITWHTEERLSLRGLLKYESRSKSTAWRGGNMTLMGNSTKYIFSVDCRYQIIK